MLKILLCHRIAREPYKLSVSLYAGLDPEGVITGGHWKSKA